MSSKIVFAPDYGLAQRRSRLVLLASRHAEIELIPPTHAKDRYVTVRDIIGELLKLNLVQLTQMIAT